MSSEPSTPTPFDKLETKSSVYDKLPPDLRRLVDRAIVDHQPATYQAVFDKFKLADHGVSFTAFYRYARRIRTNAALMETAALALPEGAPVEKFLPEIIGERFLEAALDEKTSARTLHRLAETHRIAIQNHFAKHRFAAQLEDDQRKAVSKQNAEFIKAANQILRAQANEDFMKARVAEEIKTATGARSTSEGQARHQRGSHQYPRLRDQSPSGSEGQAHPPAPTAASTRARSAGEGQAAPAANRAAVGAGARPPRIPSPQSEPERQRGARTTSSSEGQAHPTAARAAAPGGRVPARRDRRAVSREPEGFAGPRSRRAHSRRNPARPRQRPAQTCPWGCPRRLAPDTHARFILQPSSFALSAPDDALAPTPASPTASTRSPPLSLSQRRKEQRRERRREHQRRRRR